MKKKREVFTLGQEVWFEPTDKRDKGFKATIIKVGRLYYTIDKWNIKFDKETLYHGIYPCGYLYASEQEAKDAEKAMRMFFKLREHYGLKPTLKQMLEVYKILGIGENYDNRRI